MLEVIPANLHVEDFLLHVNCLSFPFKHGAQYRNSRLTKLTDLAALLGFMPSAHAWCHVKTSNSSFFKRKLQMVEY